MFYFKLSIRQIFNIYFIGYLLISFLFYIFIDSLITEDFINLDGNDLKNAILVKFFLIFIWFATSSLLLGNYLAIRISFELERIGDYFENIQNKVYKKRLILQYSTEFISLQNRISAVIERLQKLNKKMQKLNAKLKFANNNQEKLLSAISHELKNPLSSIIGYSQILFDEVQNNFHRKYIEKIIANSRRVDELLNRLRLALQIERKSFELYKKSFNLKQAINDVVSMIGGSFPARKININLEDFIIIGDEILLKQVCMNLIENALKYSQDDIFVELKNGIFKVIDRGIGIEQNEIELVVEKFYRSDKNRHMQSMGLGLTIVNWIAQLHDLKLNIESKINVGSVFLIDFNNIKN